MAFELWGCFEIRERSGLHADSERHLMERIVTRHLADDLQFLRLHARVGKA